MVPVAENVKRTTLAKEKDVFIIFPLDKEWMTSYRGQEVDTKECNQQQMLLDIKPIPMKDCREITTSSYDTYEGFIEVYIYNKSCCEEALENIC